ncbi:MAG: dolichyl-phosphate beta-glucosyltransferase [Anaerolineales bacterium]
MPSDAPYFSLVIPAHNEEARLPHTLGQVVDFLDSQPYTSEIIVVENDSSDRTFQVASAFAETNPRVRVLREPRRGKGNAVRTGLLAARGQLRMFADADFSMPVSEIPRFLPPQADADIVIASREAPGAVRYNEPFQRHLSGRVFNTLIRALVLPDLQDTQCGFKCFRAEIAEDLVRHQTLGGWSFDVELLSIARLRGYRVLELPIPWYFNAESKVSLLRDSWRMFLDLLKIRANIRRGVYDAAR